MTNQNRIELEKLGASLIGKQAQSRLLTMLNAVGDKILQPSQTITGFEIVEEFGDLDLMVRIGGVSIYYDLIINIH